MVSYQDENGVEHQAVRLNPCFNGIWSRTLLNSNNYYNEREVLILVLMEYGLVPRVANVSINANTSES